MNPTRTTALASAPVAPAALLLALLLALMLPAPGAAAAAWRVGPPARRGPPLPPRRAK